MPSEFSCYAGYIKIDNSYLLFIIACLPDELEFCMRRNRGARGTFVSHSYRSLAVPCRALIKCRIICQNAAIALGETGIAAIDGSEAPR